MSGRTQMEASALIYMCSVDVSSSISYSYQRLILFSAIQGPPGTISVLFMLFTVATTTHGNSETDSAWSQTPKGRDFLADLTCSVPFRQKNQDDYTGLYGIKIQDPSL